MSTYKEISGTRVKNFAGSDYPGAETGELWYDSANVDFRYKYPNLTTSGSWRTGTNLPYDATGVNGVGAQTAALIFGGEAPSGEVNTTNSYDGTTYTTVNSMNESRQISMNFGTSTSAIASGGELDGAPTSGKTESWNGTSWTETTDLNTARRNGGGSGSDSTSGIVFGGGEHPSYNANTESWNGSTWTEVGDLPTGQAGSSAGDSATAALFFGGPLNPSPPYLSAVTVAYNGTSWSSVNSMNTSRRLGPRGSSVGANSSSGAFYAGGYDGTTQVGKTETWDGTSWTEEGDLNVSRYNSAGAGNSTSGLCVAGSSPPQSTATEEFTGAGAPIGAWATGTSLGTPRSNMASAGESAEAALNFGGNGLSALTEQWNGSAWTEVGDLNTARNGFMGNGTSTSALGYGQDDPARSGLTESWNGTSWTEVADLNTIRRQGGGFGADNTSALAYGGENGPTDNIAATEQWNGSSWTEVNDLNTARINPSGTGIVTAGLAAGGRTVPANSIKTETEEWNGSSWSEKNDLNTARYGVFASKFNYDDVFYAGGYAGPPGVFPLNTELWNGVSWVETSDMTTGRNAGGSSGTQSAGGLAFGGGPGPTQQAATEEWSSTSEVIKVLTD